MSVKVGVGVIIEHQQKILIGKRIGGYAPYFSIPGGQVEEGESFEEAAIREIKEETNLNIKDLKLIGITNNLKTFKEEGIHFVSIILHCNSYSGELKNLESHKCESWDWFDPTDLPQPHFEASELGVEQFLKLRGDAR